MNAVIATAKHTRSSETLQSKLERELEALEWEMYLRQQSDDRYWSNGSFRADDLKRSELRKRIAEHM